MPFCYECGDSLPSAIPTERLAVGPFRYVCILCYKSKYSLPNLPNSNSRLEKLIADVRVETAKTKTLVEELKIRLANL